MTIFSSLPTWVQELYTWVTTGFSITTFLGVVVAVFKVTAANKNSKEISSVQVTLLETITDKLSDIKNLAIIISGISDKVTDALAYFENAISVQKQANMDLANFVMACFDKSNLSPETKAELKLLADTLFYNDSSIIDTLKQANIEASNAILEKAKRIEELENKLAKEKQKLVIAQENTKSNRRL